MDKIKRSSKVHSHKHTDTNKNNTSEVEGNDQIKRSPFWWVPILLALITFLGTVCAAAINNGLLLKFLPSPTPAPIFTFTPTLTSIFAPTASPTLSPKPTISPLNYQYKNLDPIIDKKFAPYDVFVSGTVSNAGGYYLYLIVEDKAKKWVQKPLGLITGDKLHFSGHCFLGESPTDPYAQNETYIIYAVISKSGSYEEHHGFTDPIPVAISASIYLVRNDPPIPTTPSP